MLFALISFLYSCTTFQKSSEKSEFSFEPPNIRIERFPETFNLKGKGAVRCAENTCNEIESKMPKLKTLPKNGLWEEYAEREVAGGKRVGFLIKKGQYTDNQPTGVWEEYAIKEDSQGIFYSVLDKKGKYVDGKRDGLWQYFYDDGPNATKSVLLKETIFKAGLKEGIEKRYNREGLVIEESNYVNDKLHGKYIKKSPKGVLLIEGEYYMDKKTGEWKEYQEEREGALKSITNYKDDKKHGKQILYYADGKTKLAEGNFENDLETGTWKYFYENGKLEKEGSYIPEVYSDAEEEKIDPKKPKTKRKGVWKKYYRNGNLFSEGMLDGKPVGEWRFYYNNGKLAAQGVMRNEFMLSEGSIYDVMGNLVGKGSFMTSMLKLNEQTQEFEITYKPKVPFTLYKNGKKSMDLTPEIQNGYNVAILYDEAGNEIGKGPIEIMTQKKNGCWVLNGKKVFYLMDKATSGAMAKMNNCE